MANAIYPKAKEKLLSAGVNLTSDDIRIVLVDLADYAYSAAHDYLDDVPSGARIATSASLSGKSVTNGVFDASDLSVAGVTGDSVEAMIVYVHTGTDSTAILLAFVDSASSGFPYTPNGGSVDIQFDNGAYKIFAI